MSENDVFVSVCLIMKDEEAVLGRCLSSVRGADEVVVLDTGSSDGSVKLARVMGARVIEGYVWEESFAKARNEALKHCRGRWVFWIDADDWLESAWEGVPAAALAAEEAGRLAAAVKIVSAGSYHFFPNLHRRLPGKIYWEGAAHNYLEGQGRSLRRPEVVIRRGKSPNHGRNPDRTLNILRREVREGRGGPRELYYLAREFWYRREFDAAVGLLRRQVEVDEWRPQRAEGWLLIAKCLWKLQRGSEAREACLRAVGENPDFREALVLLGEMYFEPWRSRWLDFASRASNEGVLFIRDVSERLFWPMSFTREQVARVRLGMDAAVAAVAAKRRRGGPMMRVLEWGAGRGTRFWTDWLGNRGLAFEWVCVESDPGWADWAEGIGGVIVLERQVEGDAYLSMALVKNRCFDVILVDGWRRSECLAAAWNCVADSGVVFLHDAERPRYQQAMAEWPGAGECVVKGLWEGRRQKDEG